MLILRNINIIGARLPKYEYFLRCELTVEEGLIILFKFMCLYQSDIACKQVQDILESKLEDLTEDCLSNIFSQLYTRNPNAEQVKLSYTSIMEEFASKFLVKNEISQLMLHCQVFLEYISYSDDHNVVKALSAEWGKVFGSQSLLPSLLQASSPPHMIGKTI